MRPIRTGVVGVGNMGQHHARIWAVMPGSQLVGVADPDVERAHSVAARHGVPVYADYRDLLGRVDAVSLAAPTTLHYEIGLACIERGVHVLVEKPLAARLSEARRLVEAGRETGTVLQVGHVERFNPTFVELTHVLSDRQILAMDARRLSPFANRAADVSVICDLMVHDLDLILNLVEAPVTDLKAVGVKTLSPQLDHAIALVTFGNGCMASLSASKVTQHKVRQLAVTCADSFIVADLLARTVMVYRQSAADYFAQQGNVLYRQEGVIEHVYVPPVEPLFAELQHFLSCVQNGSEPSVSGAGVLRVMELASEIEALALTGLGVQG
jgi:predicted dehydrogenase